MLICIETDDSKNLFFHLFCQMNFKVRIYFSDSRQIASGRSWSVIARNVSLFFRSEHSHTFIHRLSLCHRDKDNSSTTPRKDFLPSVAIIRNKLHTQNFSVSLCIFQFSPTHCTTRITTYTYCTYCCHNTEKDRQDFKFSVFKNF